MAGPGASEPKQIDVLHLPVVQASGRAICDLLVRLQSFNIENFGMLHSDILIACPSGSAQEVLMVIKEWQRAQS